MRAPASPYFLSPLVRRAAFLALLTPALSPQASLAQSLSPAVTTNAAAPEAPATPLSHSPLAPAVAAPAPADIGPPLGWRDANDAVAAFPRGHADILAWEAQQKAAPKHRHQLHQHQHHPKASGGQP